MRVVAVVVAIVGLLVALGIGLSRRDDSDALDRTCDLAHESARLTVGETELSQAEREQRMAEIMAELQESGTPEVREMYATLSTIEDLPPAAQQQALRDLSVEIGSYLDEHC